MPKEKTGKYSGYLKNKFREPTQKEINAQLLGDKRSIDIEKARSGYQTVVDGDTLKSKTMTGLLDEESAYKILTGQASRVDSSRHYPQGALSKPEKTFDPAKETVTNFFKFDTTGGYGRKKRYYAENADGNRKYYDTKEEWELDKAVEEKAKKEATERKKKFLKKPSKATNPGAGKPKLEF